MSDLIERQAAIDAVKEEEYPCESDYDEGYMAALDKAIWVIEKWLPSAQPERKKGKWINGYCSNCREHAPYWPMASTYYESKFCPNCGSYNGGEQE